MLFSASRQILTALSLCSLLAAASVRRSSADASAAPKASAEWYFWNEITGETQWEDPGDVPFEEEGAILVDADGRAAGLRSERAQVFLGGELERGAQAPVLLQPEDEGVNMEKPVDLAWRRVKNKSEL